VSALWSGAPVLDRVHVGAGVLMACAVPLNLARFKVHDVCAPLHASCMLSRQGCHHTNMYCHREEKRLRISSKIPLCAALLGPAPPNDMCGGFSYMWFTHHICLKCDCVLLSDDPSRRRSCRVPASAGLFHLHLLSHVPLTFGTASSHSTQWAT
jgi:hypothetical protein